MSLSYKIVLFGNVDGKTRFLNNIRHDTFEKNKYITTNGIEVYPITVGTRYGNITLNFWDCTCSEKMSKPENTYLGTDALMVFFDMTQSAWENSPNFIKKYATCMPNFKKLCPAASLTKWGNRNDRIEGDAPFICIYEAFEMLYRFLTNDKNHDVSPVEITQKESVEELFNQLKEKDSRINELLDLINEKNLIISKLVNTCQSNFDSARRTSSDLDKHKKLFAHVINELIQKAEEERKWDYSDSKILEIFKIATPIYMEVASDVWTMNKNEFIEKHHNSLPSGYIDVLKRLYNKSRGRREEILMQNGIFKKCCVELKTEN